MAAQVTVTAERRGGVSAALRGWRWPPSHCAGEWKTSVMFLGCRLMLTFIFNKIIYLKHSQAASKCGIT